MVLEVSFDEETSSGSGIEGDLHRCAIWSGRTPALHSASFNI